MISTIAVIGAGTMGSGIAQVSAQAGCATILCDVNPIMIEKAKESIQKNLDFLLNKKKINAEEKDAVYNRIQFENDIEKCKADLIIEAIVENMDAKISLFKKLAAVNNPETIFASNTSSLSISELQNEIPYSERVVGLHFFNPAPLMKLVEVVKGKQTADRIIHTLRLLCEHLNKNAVLCADAPGFIVNRVARHYYLEAMKLVESGIATFENVDTIMESSGFKMGPFKLMDLIGMDINLKVSESIYEAFKNAERFKPSQLQIEKVHHNHLGRKTGKGFYDYTTK
ncbi:N/A [soil metagenome]